jgi:hypothetical protein
VALLAALCAAALFEIPSLAQKEKPAHNVYWFFFLCEGGDSNDKKTTD